MRHQAQGLVVFLVSLSMTSGSLAALHTAAPHADRGAELAVLVASNLAATAVRFVLLRAWVFPEQRDESCPDLPSRDAEPENAR